jgi:hypothetical protein
MNVLLVQADGKLPNLALMKLSTYHKAQGDTVGFNVGDPDKVYVSVVFKANKEKMNGLGMLYPNAEVVYGGPGYSLSAQLPDEIECLKPDYSIYPDMDYSMGFTTRGCIRKCHFCIVPEKEGKLTRAQHPREFHDSRFSKIMLLDNNILADRDWFFEVSQWILARDLAVLEHGMDIRLMDAEVANRLKAMTWANKLHFAYDHDNDRSGVLRGIEILKKAEMDLRGAVQFYVYVDSPDELESGANRCQELKALGTNAFVQYNIDRKPTKAIQNLRRWANRKWLYWSMDYADYRGA